jgi:hypothetical protein
MRIHFLTNKLHQIVGFCIAAIACVVFLLCLSLMQPVSAQVPATSAESESVEQVHPFRALLDQVIVQLNGVVSYTAQAIDAVRPNSNQADSSEEAALPSPRSDLTLPASAQFPSVNLGSGTFIINAPLSVRQSLAVTGGSRLATTTVSGLFSAGVMAGSNLTIGNTITTDSLQVDELASIERLTVSNAAEINGALQVDGLASIERLTVSNDVEINGALRALGGIITDGANIDVASGSIFASNVVNEIVAGSNVTVTGSRNTPTISFVPEPFDGVLEINGERGTVEFEAGEDIEINGLEIENISDLDSVRSRGGCAGCIDDSDVSNILTLSGGTINGTSIGLGSAAAAAFSTVNVGNALSSSSAFTVLSTGTSTFGGTVNIESGCFAENGVCIGGLTAPTYLGLPDTPGSYLSGSLQYANASATALTQSAGLVFAGDNLGIGTSTPSARLTVEGDSLLIGAVSVISGTSSQFRGGLNVTDGCVSVDGTCLGGAAEIGDLNDVTLATTSDGDILIYDGTAWTNVSSSTLGFGDGTFLGLADTPQTYLARSVSYVNATSSALTQSANFVYDGTRLAVGTPSPVTTLTVGGDLSMLDGSLTRWYDNDSSNYAGFRAPAVLGSNIEWILPAIDGGSNEILVTDGSGNLRFDSVESVGGGSPDFIGLTDTPAGYITNGIPFTSTSSLLFSNEFVFDGQNLGIGVELPLAPLTVQGNTRLQAVNDAVGFYYNASADTVGIGTLNADARLAVENGSILQQGGRASSTYTPNQIGSLDLVSNPSANDVQVIGNRAYVVSSSAGDDFHILDISNPVAPVEVGSLNLPTTASRVFVVGNYAYVVSSVTGDDFHIIDISNPMVPVEVGSLNLPTSANDVFVQGRYAYVVTDNVGDDFHIIDISSPSSPQIVGETDLSDSGTAVKVRGQYAYVTTRGTDEDFHVIDISSSTAPTSTDSIFLSDAANDVFIKENYAYVVSNNGGDDFHIINISDPSAVVEVGGIDLVTSAVAVTVSGKYAYIASAATGDDLHVIDISSATTPVEVGAIELAAGAGTGVAVAGRYAYITTTNTGKEFYVVDLTGIEAQSGVMHSLQSGSMTVLGDTVLSGRLDVGEGLLVGDVGIYSQGAVYAAGTDSSYFLGDMSIGTTSANSELTVDGVIQATNLVSGGTTNLMADAQGNIILEVSDQRLKENVHTLTGSLDKILGLRGVSYAWKDKDRFGDQQEIGFLAQEVDEVVPEVVRKGGAYWSLNTKNLLALVVEAMKEMWSVVNGNQNRIEELETRIRELENRNSSSTVATQILEQDEEAAKENIQPELVDEKDSDAKAQSGADEEEVEVRLVGTPSSTSTMATTTTATTTSELDADSETLLPVQENNQSEPVAPEMPSDDSVEIVETTLDTTNTTASSSESHIDPQEPHMLLESTGEADEGEIATSVIDESTANSE